MNSVSEERYTDKYTEPSVTATYMFWAMLNDCHENINQKNTISIKLILVPQNISVTYNSSVLNEIALRNSKY